MKPRRTHTSNQVYHLEGGNEDNDLWLYDAEDGALRSTWEPTDEERQAIAEGANITLVVWGPGHPPVAMGISTEPLGKPRA